MDYEREITTLKAENQILSDKIDFLEFRLELLAENSNASSLLFECKITRSQYSLIMDLMDEQREKLDKNENVNHIEFETSIGEITGNHDYHFAELVAKAFMEDGRWDEVFPALYGDMPKYKYYLESRNNNK